MPLKALVTNLDEVPEAQRGFYVAQKGPDGKDAGFRLDVEAAGGLSLENVDGLKNSLARERDARKAAEAKGANGASAIELIQAREALEAAQKLAAELPGKEAALADVQAKYQKLQAEFAAEKLDRELLEAARKHHAIDPHLLLPFAKARTAVVDGKVVAVGPDGQPRKVLNEDGELVNMTADDALAEMWADKKFGPLFKSTTGTGTRAVGTGSLPPGTLGGNQRPADANDALARAVASRMGA